MKIIIISDITGDSNSIIPWGLNLGKYTGSEVDILHLIDPREKQGVESQFGDSQSITPGEKLSPDKIRNREEEKAKIELDKLLSKEASRLNYPLKINKIVETQELEKKLKTIRKENQELLLLTSSKLENTIFSDLNEFFAIIRNFDSPAFIIPPGKDFYKLERTFLLTDFSRSPDVTMKNMFKWVAPFSPLVSACEVTKKMDQFIKTDLVSKTWKQGVQKYIDPSILLKTLKLKGDNYAETIINYVERNKFECVILPKSKKESKKNLFSSNITKRLIESLNKPVLLY